MDSAWIPMSIKLSSEALDLREWKEVRNSTEVRSQKGSIAHGYLKIINTCNKPVEMVIDLGWVDDCKLKIYRDTCIQEGRLGHFISRAERLTSDHSGFLHSPSVFNVSLEANERIEIVLCSKKITPFVHIAPRVTNYDLWQIERSEFLRTRNLFQGIFFGFLLVIICYNLFLFLNTRQLPHLHYALYAFSLFISLLPPLEMVYDSFLEPYPFLIRHIEIAGDFGFVLFYLLFMKSFLSMKSNYPGLNKIVTLNIWWLAGALIVCQIWFAITRVHYPTQWLYQFSSVLSIVAFLYIYYKLSFAKDILARYILTGSLLALLGAAFVLYNVIFTDEYPIYSHYVMQAGHMGELIIFLLGLSIRSKLQLQEAFKVSELSQYQRRFFTNISHEFRTPLTLIREPIERLLESPASRDQKKQFEYIKSNTQRLENLINQILKLAELESKDNKLMVDRGDFEAIITRVISDLSLRAQKKEVDVHLITRVGHEPMYFNTEACYTIIFNLIDNALKFVDKKGLIEIRMREESPYVLIEVLNTGKGIEAEHMDQIFNRYYYNQDNSGDLQSSSGIGLNLVRELVKWHKGEVSVSSEPGLNTVFSVKIPTELGFYEREQVDHRMNSMNKYITRETNDKFLLNYNTPTIINKAGSSITCMIVEDNPEMNRFLVDLFQEEYNVISCKNGEEAWNIIQTEEPELIIADYMMPVLNGIELCRKLKGNVATNHIPIIILTAKADHNTKIESLECEADSFVSKPFDQKELLLKVRNILAERKRIRAYLRNTDILTIHSEELPAIDEVFLKNVKKAIEENLSKENFGVEELAAILNLSRSQLHRKLTNIMGQSPNHLLRVARLETAHKLLKNKSATVAEVAYKTGFNTPNYFSKCFKEYFGFPPSEL